MVLRTYNQAELDYLVRCEKVITVPPRKEMLLKDGHYRNDMFLDSKDGAHKFSVFIRQHERFPENFSVGLTYIPRDGSSRIVIFRCNGPHGEHVFGKRHHACSHVHKAKDYNINAGKKSDLYAEEVDAYINLEEALRYFMDYCNIGDAGKYLRLEKDTQITLFDKGIENG